MLCDTTNDVLEFLSQLENALQRLEKLPRHLQEIKETGIDRPVQPEAGVDAALGAAYTSQGRSNIGDDAALVGASEVSFNSLQAC